MRIEKVRIEGFRLLEDVEIMLEQKSTVIVGRNNSGKTSLTDVFDRFAGEAGPRFRLEDFSTGIRSKFVAAKALRGGGASPEALGPVSQRAGLEGPVRCIDPFAAYRKRCKL